jgi:hypothetical protein
MICLRSQLHLENSITASDLWSIICTWRSRSNNTPSELKKWFSQTGFEKLPLKPQEKTVESTTVSVYKINEKSFALKLTEGPVITSICFDLNLKGTNFTMEIERPGSRDFKISRPKIFDHLLPYLNSKNFKKRAHAASDWGMISNIINGKSFPDTLPVIYISRTNHDTLLINPEELAEKLFGVAHVFYEPNLSFSRQLKASTEGKSPYNGAAGIFSNNTRFIVKPEEVNGLDYFYRLSKISIKQPQVPELTWYAMVMPYLQKTTSEYTEQISDLTAKINKLKTIDINQKKELSKTADENKLLQSKIEELEEKLSQSTKIIAVLNQELKAERTEKDGIRSELERQKRENEEYHSVFDSELTEAQEKIEALTKENEKLQNYKDIFDRKDTTKAEDINISIKMTEKSLYPGEIEDFIKGIIYAVSKKWSYYNSGRSEKDKSGYPRICDILKSLFENNPELDFDKSKTAELLRELDTGKLKGDDEYRRILEHAGFYGARDKGHTELFFHGDKRYSITAPKTHSDNHSIKNNCLQAKKCIPDVNAVKLP